MYRSVSRGVAIAFGVASVILFCTGAVAHGADTIFPSTKGSTWKYEYPSGKGFRYTITASSPTRFTQVQTGDVSMVMHFKLSPQGWVSADVGKVHIRMVHEHKIKIKVVDTSGVVIPKSSLWKPGYNWHFGMTDKSTATNGPFTVVGLTTVDSHLKIIGYKNITVPAGTFHCCRVKALEHITSVIKVAGQVQTRQMVMHIMEYYAMGVGLVERTVNHVTAKLISYKIAP